MSDDLSAEIRKQVYGLIDAASDTASDTERRTLSARAFCLAQQAEVIERNGHSTDQSGPVLNGQLKAAAESNIRHFIEQLYTASDCEQRQTFLSLLLHERRWFGSKQDWQEFVRRLLHECDSRILRCRALFDRDEIIDIATTEAHLYLNNLLDVQKLLRRLQCPKTD